MGRVRSQGRHTARARIVCRVVGAQEPAARFADAQKAGDRDRSGGELACQARGRINHDAHLGGALFGVVFVMLTDPAAFGQLLRWAGG